MKILYDLQALQPDDSGSLFHGGGEYARYLLEKALTSGYGNDNEIDALYTGKKHIDRDVLDFCEKNGINLVDMQNISDLSMFLNNERYDVFYSALPYEGYGSLRLDKTVFMSTVHGLRVLEMPYDMYELRYSKGIKKLLVFCFKVCFTRFYKRLKKREYEKIMTRRNAVIHTDTFHSKYSIINNFPHVDKGKIKVFYPPINDTHVRLTQKEEQDIVHRYGIDDKEYVLIISANRWIKNACRAIKALDSLYDRFSIDKKVLVLGADDRKRYGLKHRDNFIFSSYVPSQDLEVLYKHAFVLLYPTLNEGFGYPPVDAMKYGTPVVASAIASVTEVCRDAVLYVNPFSIDEIQNRILRLCDDAQLYRDLSQKGKKRYTALIASQKKSLPQQLEIIFGPLKK